MKLFRIKVSVLFIILATAIFSQSCTLNRISQVTNNQKQPSKDSVIRILAIGNSFSDDAVEHYLYDLAKAGGYKVIIGNLYIAGASLDVHVKSVREDKGNYSYRKISVNGKKSQTPKISIANALADENWNYISFQQASSNSGLYDTYVNTLPILFNYVKERTTNPNVKYMLHQTWAYAQNSTHKGFANYNRDQMQMYHAIVDASQKVMKAFPFDILIPAGTAIQNARTTLGYVMCRDGYHLDLNIGRYTASCVWFETIFKESVVGNTFKPAKVTEEQAKVGQQAAHKATLKPYRVTKLKWGSTKPDNLTSF